MRAVAPVLALTGTIALLAPWMPRPSRQTPTQSPAPTDAPAEACDTLFPALDAQAVDALSVVTPERSFSFAADEDGVSVNGQMADGEVFETLVEQITAIPVISCDAFTPQGTPLLTLTLDCGGVRFTASFYAQAASDVYADVISGTEGTWRYCSTKAWHIGKLVLTCDGTRIQDERGNETPAAGRPAA